MKCRGRIYPTRGFDKSNPYAKCSATLSGSLSTKEKKYGSKNQVEESGQAKSTQLSHHRG